MTAAHYTTHNTDLFLLGLLIIVLVLIVFRILILEFRRARHIRRRNRARKTYFNIRDGH